MQEKLRETVRMQAVIREGPAGEDAACRPDIGHPAACIRVRPYIVGAWGLHRLSFTRHPPQIYATECC